MEDSKKVKEDGGDLAGPRPNAKRRVQGGRGPYNTTKAAVQKLECKFSLGFIYYSSTC